MRKNSGTDWMTMWAAVLICAVLWILFDRSSVEYAIDAVARRWDFNRILAAGFVAFGVLNLLALAARILQWGRE